jgi:hypothetical protein
VSGYEIKEFSLVLLGMGFASGAYAIGFAGFAIIPSFTKLIPSFTSASFFERISHI